MAVADRKGATVTDEDISQEKQVSKQHFSVLSMFYFDTLKCFSRPLRMLRAKLQLFLAEWTCAQRSWKT